MARANPAAFNKILLDAAVRKKVGRAQQLYAPPAFLLAVSVQLYRGEVRWSVHDPGPSSVHQISVPLLAPWLHGQEHRGYGVWWRVMACRD